MSAQTARKLANGAGSLRACRMARKCCTVRSSRRRATHEDAAHTRPRVDVDVTGHELGDGLGDRQAETGAAEETRGRVVGLLEGLEDAGLSLLVDAHARVGDAEVQLDGLVEAVVRVVDGLDRLDVRIRRRLVAVLAARPLDRLHGHGHVDAALGRELDWAMSASSDQSADALAFEHRLVNAVLSRQASPRTGGASSDMGVAKTISMPRFEAESASWATMSSTSWRTLNGLRSSTTLLDSSLA